MDGACHRRRARQVLVNEMLGKIALQPERHDGGVRDRYRVLVTAGAALCGTLNDSRKSLNVNWPAAANPSVQRPRTRTRSDPVSEKTLPMRSKSFGTIALKAADSSAKPAGSGMLALVGVVRAIIRTSGPGVGGSLRRINVIGGCSSADCSCDKDHVRTPSTPDPKPPRLSLPLTTANPLAPVVTRARKSPNGATVADEFDD